MPPFGNHTSTDSHKNTSAILQSHCSSSSSNSDSSNTYSQHHRKSYRGTTMMQTTNSNFPSTPTSATKLTANKVHKKKSQPKRSSFLFRKMTKKTSSTNTNTTSSLSSSSPASQYSSSGRKKVLVNPMKKSPLRRSSPTAGVAPVTTVPPPPPSSSPRYATDEDTDDDEFLNDNDVYDDADIMTQCTNPGGEHKKQHQEDAYGHQLCYDDDDQTYKSLLECYEQDDYSVCYSSSVGSNFPPTSNCTPRTRMIKKKKKMMLQMKEQKRINPKLLKALDKGDYIEKEEMNAVTNEYDDLMSVGSESVLAEGQQYGKRLGVAAKEFADFGTAWDDMSINHLSELVEEEEERCDAIPSTDDYFAGQNSKDNKEENQADTGGCTNKKVREERDNDLQQDKGDSSYYPAKNGNDQSCNDEYFLNHNEEQDGATDLQFPKDNIPSPPSIPTESLDQKQLSEFVTRHEVTDTPTVFNSRMSCSIESDSSCGGSESDKEGKGYTTTTDQNGFSSGKAKKQTTNTQQNSDKTDQSSSSIDDDPKMPTDGSALRVHTNAENCVFIEETMFESFDNSEDDNTGEQEKVTKKEIKRKGKKKENNEISFNEQGHIRNNIKQHDSHPHHLLKQKSSFEILVDLHEMNTIVGNDKNAAAVSATYIPNNKNDSAVCNGDEHNKTVFATPLLSTKSSDETTLFVRNVIGCQSSSTIMSCNSQQQQCQQDVSSRTTSHKECLSNNLPIAFTAPPIDNTKTPLTVTSTQHSLYFHSISNNTHNSKNNNITDLATHPAPHPSSTTAREITAAREAHIRASQHLKAGETQAALTLFLQILQMNLVEYGPIHSSVGNAHHNVAISYMRLGRYTEPFALTYAMEAVMVRRALLGDTNQQPFAHPQQQEQYTMLNCSSMMMQQELSSGIITQLRGKMNDLSTSLLKLGVCQLSLQKFDGAITSFQECLNLRRTLLYRNHSSKGNTIEPSDISSAANGVAQVLTHIGQLYFECGELLSSCTAFEEALVIQRGLLHVDKNDDNDNDNSSNFRGDGSNHMEFDGGGSNNCENNVGKIPHRNDKATNIMIAETLANLGTIRTKRKQFGLAVIALEDAVKFRQAIFKEGHNTLLQTMDNLAFAYSKDGKNAFALKVYKKMLRAQIATLGAFHLDNAKTLTKMSIVHEKLGNYTEAYGCTLENKLLQERALQQRMDSTDNNNKSAPASSLSSQQWHLTIQQLQSDYISTNKTLSRLEDKLQRGCLNHNVGSSRSNNRHRK